NGIDPAPQPLARDEHVRLQSIGLPSPHDTGAQEARLYFVGDVESAVATAEILAGLQVTFIRKRGAIGRGDRFDNEGRHVATAQRAVERIDVIEGDLEEFVRTIRQEYLREAIVTRRDRQPGMTVVTFDDRYDLAPFCGVSGGFERDL